MGVLYKLDSKGKMRQWGAVAIDDTIQEQSGLVGGKLTPHVKVAKPKNIGRSNATTAAEQAELEVEAKYTKKLKEGYSTTIVGANSDTRIKPMLAHEYGKHSHKVKFPCFVQPKLDGMRCLGNKEGLTSRTGSPIETMNHILKEIKDSGTGALLDGELYAHGKTFQENMKLIKKYRPGKSEEVKYHVYDQVVEFSFAERHNALQTILLNMGKNVVPVPTFVINNEEELATMHAEFLEQGYEGTMVRWGVTPYKVAGRSDGLLKYKDFKDIACEIVDIIPMDSRPDQGLVVCKHNGQTFKATPKMSHEGRRELLKDRDIFIGKMAEIRYFEKTDGGLPRFPVYVGERLDK